MTYRELLELYKQGKLEEQKRKEIEADIEKQDAISEYLYEEDVLPEFDFDDINSEAENEELQTEMKFAKMIQRSIRRAFIKLGVVVAIGVLATILFAQLALPNIVSAFYYDPGKIVKGYTNQMSLDMAVYTELYMPGYYRNDISTRKRGYGNYEIRINQPFSIDDHKPNTVAGKIERNKLTYYNNNSLTYPGSNIFEWSFYNYDYRKSLSDQVAKPQERKRKDGSIEIILSYNGAAGLPKDSEEVIEELDSKQSYLAYVSLDRILSYEEFVKFLTKWDELYDIWCAPLVASDANGARNIGFHYNTNYGTGLEWDKKEYPYLQLWDREAEDVDIEKQMKSEVIAKQHFISMLDYIDNQKKFYEMMNAANEASQSQDKYQQYVDYVKKNGLNIYGFAAVTQKEELLKLIDDKEVYSIYVTNYE